MFLALFPLLDFMTRFGIPKKISGDAIVKKLIAVCLILTASLPIAFMTGCGSSSSPTSASNTATSTSTAVVKTSTPTATIVPAGPAAPSLGSALTSNFAVLAEGAITDSSETIDGNLGSAGAYNISSPLAVFVGADANNPYTPGPGSIMTNALAAIFGTGIGVGNGGAYNITLAQYPSPTSETYTGTSLSLSPGVYSLSDTAASYNITLENAGGNPNNVYILFVNTFSSGASSTITLHNVLAANVYWVSTGAMNLGASSTIAGNILCSAAVNFGTNVALEGRVFAYGAIGFTSTTGSTGADSITNP